MAFFDFLKRSNKEQRALTDDYCQTALSGLNLVNFHSNNSMSLSAIYSAIELISNTLAEIPIEVKQRDEQSKTHTLKQHSIKFAINNSQLTRFMLIKCAVSDMLRHGNGFIYLNRAKDGIITELVYVPATDVTIYYNKRTRKTYYQCINIGKVEPRDILHFYLRSEDGINGISVFKYASRTIETANYVENTALDYYAKSGMTTGLLKAKTALIGKQAADAMKLVQGEINTTKSSNLIKFIPYDLDFIQLSTNPIDSQLAESRKFNVEEVARFLCVPLPLLDGSQISNIESVNIQFLLQCIQPILTLVEEEINRKMLSASERETIFIDFDENELLRTNKQSTASYLQTLTNAGIITRNEAREMLGLNAVDGADSLSVAYSDIKQNTIENDSDK